MSTLLKKSVALFATAAILASTSVTAFAADEKVEPTGNYDKVVWIGAKDVKAKKGTGDYDTLMKSESFAHVASYSGGKIGVAVVKKATASDEAAFVKLFDDKGKLDQAKAKEGKDLASAKYKDGVVTVTAGKNPGEVDVWVYETKKVDGKMTVVNASNLATGAGQSMNKTGSATVKPTKYEFTVKAAVTGPQFVIKPASGDVQGIKAPTDTDKNIGTIEKGDKTVALAIKADAEKATIYIADKKVEASKDNTWTILAEDKTKYDAAIITLDSSAKVSYDSGTKAFKLENITAKGEGKTTINIQNDQSGKVLKVPVVVTKWIKVSGDSAIKMSVDGGTAASMSSSGTYVAPKSKVTFDKKVKVDGKEYEAGKAVTITKDTTVEEVKAAS